MTVVAKFEIECHRVMSPDGRLAGELPKFAGDRVVLAELYRWMVLTRTFDEKAIALQRTGQLGTYASSLGQEAVNIGLAHAMAKADVLLPGFREHGAQMLRGVTPKELFMYWGGDERGSAFAGPRNDFPVSIPVGSHAAHAAGAGLAFKLRGEARAAVAVFGDGATSKGHERCRRLGAASRVCRRKQPVGDLGSAQGSDGGGNARPEGNRSRLRRCAG
jgi:pyruvate dehydrogenase E1 component alpha subunit